MHAALQLRFVNVALWLGPLGPDTAGSIDPLLDGVFDQELLELLAVLRALPRCGRAVRYSLRFTLARAFRDGEMTCTAGVEAPLLRALVAFAEERRLEPAGATILDSGKEIPKWRYLDGVRARRWKRPEAVEEDSPRAISVG